MASGHPDDVHQVQHDEAAAQGQPAAAPGDQLRDRQAGHHQERAFRHREAEPVPGAHSGVFRLQRGAQALSLRSGEGEGADRAVRLQPEPGAGARGAARPLPAVAGDRPGDCRPARGSGDQDQDRRDGVRQLAQQVSQAREPRIARVHGAGLADARCRRIPDAVRAGQRIRVLGGPAVRRRDQGGARHRRSGETEGAVQAGDGDDVPRGAGRVPVGAAVHLRAVQPDRLEAARRRMDPRDGHPVALIDT